MFSLSAIVDGRATELTGRPGEVFSLSFDSDTDAAPTTCNPDTGMVELKNLDGGDEATDDGG